MKERNSVGFSIRSVNKRYGSTISFNYITSDIEAGEFVSLLSPAGSSKITLFGALGGFVLPTAGSVWVGNQEMTYMPLLMRNISIVFQYYVLFPRKTLGENLAFPMRARRHPKFIWTERGCRALSMQELDGYQDCSVSQLSGGEYQRLTLAWAMFFEACRILMDQPLSALDKELRESMQIELRQLHRKLGSIILYMTHDQREALFMSDRVAILKDGELVQIGAPASLSNEPKDSFVASFISDATMLPMTSVGDDHVRLGEVTLRSAKAIFAHSELLLAFQNEKSLSDEGRHEPDVNRLKCRIREVMYQGNRLRLFLELEDGMPLSLRQPSHYVAQERNPTNQRKPDSGPVSGRHHRCALSRMPIPGGDRRLT